MSRTPPSLPAQATGLSAHPSRFQLSNASSKAPLTARLRKAAAQAERHSARLALPRSHSALARRKEQVTHTRAGTDRQRKASVSRTVLLGLQAWKTAALLGTPRLSRQSLTPFPSAQTAPSLRGFTQPTRSRPRDARSDKAKKQRTGTASSALTVESESNGLFLGTGVFFHFEN